MSRITLKYVPEDEWHGEMLASVDSAGYSGSGAAWFSIKQLRSFGVALDTFPIFADAPISLAGGFWKADDTIDQTHVGISISPYDRVGALVVSVQLSTPTWDGARHDMHHAVVAHLRTDYACLAGFRNSFLALIEGRSDVAELKGQ